MDNLTHSLTGLLLSRAGLNRVHPQASWILLLAANAPDVDAISLMGGPGAYFVYHRWLTHALAAAPVITVLPVLIVRMLFWKRPFRWRRAWILSLAGVASHILLDWTNPYGIRLYLPVSEAWPGLDITSVVDVWIWGILLASSLWPMLSWLVGSEIGVKSKPGAGWAIAGLALLLCYDVARWFIHWRAISVQQGRVYNGHAPRRVYAMPSHLNPLVWEGIVETSSFYVIQTVDLTKDFHFGEPRIFYKPRASPAIEAARQTELFDTFLRFSPTPLWRLTPQRNHEEDVTRVEAIDLRFGFTATAIVDGDNRVLTTSFRF